MNKINKAEHEAYKLLIELGITEPPVPVERVASLLNLEIIPQEFEDDLSGILISNASSGVISYNRNQPRTRNRFTVAHEIGHFILHVKKKQIENSFFVDLNNSVGAVYRRDTKSASGDDMNEIEANAFAAALLMPENMLRVAMSNENFVLDDESGIKHLAKMFGVSEAAMTYRLGRLFDRLG